MAKIMLMRLPEIGEGVVEAEIQKWIAKEGEKVRKFQNIVEVMADKGSLELPSPYTGTLRKILAPPGKVVKVGEPIAEILVEDEEPQSKAEAHSEAQPPKPVQGEEQKPPAPQQRARPKASPAVRRLAAELGVPLEKVKGTGPHGTITREDVLRFHEQAKEQPPAPKPTAPPEKPAREALPPPPAPAPPTSALVQAVPAAQVHGAWPVPGVPKPPRKEDEERIPVKGVRRFIAERMMRSWLRIPHAMGSEIVEADSLVEARERLKPYAEREGVKLTYLPFIVKAVVKALQEYPMLNALYDPEWDEIIVKKSYNIGIAVDTPQGLVVPVVRDADKKTLLEVAREIQELARKAREGKLSVDEVRGSSFTITNIGSIGGYVFFPIINYPEVAILGVSTIRRELTPEGERMRMLITVSFNHMVTDGAYATRFLLRLKELLEEPMLLI